MAKAPVAGRAKTRLCPPLSPEQAASVAEAALAQTLEAVAACSAERKLLALDGEPGGWLPPGFSVFRQEGDTFSERLARAWASAGGPGVQIGMDTPQITPALLDGALDLLASPPVTAVLGPALDGGWWALGLDRGWDVDVFAGVEMSTPRTGARQLESLRAAGHRVGLLPQLRDIDAFDDLVAVAGEMAGRPVASALLRTGVVPA